LDKERRIPGSFLPTVFCPLYCWLAPVYDVAAVLAIQGGLRRRLVKRDSCVCTHTPVKLIHARCAPGAYLGPRSPVGA